jgi:hypothetical protein
MMNGEGSSGLSKKKICGWQQVGFPKSNAGSKGYRAAVSFKGRLCKPQISVLADLSKSALFYAGFEP